MVAEAKDAIMFRGEGFRATHRQSPLQRKPPIFETPTKKMTKPNFLWSLWGELVMVNADVILCGLCARRGITMQGPTARWVLQKRIEEVGTNFRTFWDLYLKFYTVFLTLNVAALAWFFAAPRTPLAKWIIVVAFVIQNLFASITSWKMYVLSRLARIQHYEAAKQLHQLAIDEGETVDEKTVTTTPIPFDIGEWGGRVNCICVLLLSLIWIALAFLSDTAAGNGFTRPH